MAKRLRKIAVTATKAYDAELRQIPTAATCKVYKQGATVTTGTSISSGGSGTIVVRDIGRVQVGDVLRVNVTASPTLTVTALPSSTQITGTAAGGTFTVVTDDRLVITSDRPSTYRESTGVSATASANQFSCDATTGYGYCYAREGAVDIEFSGTGITTRMLVDEETGEIRPGIYAQDYDTLQEALDAVPTGGGTVYLPPGTIDITAYAPITPKWGTTIKGAGCRGWVETGAGGGPSAIPSSATVIYCSNVNKNIITLTNAGYCKLEDFEVKGAGSAGTQVGILLAFSGGNTIVPSMNLRNVTVYQCGKHGVHVDSGYMSTFHQLNCWENEECGFFVEQSTALTMPSSTFTCCVFVDNGTYGFKVDGTGSGAGWGMQMTTFNNCVFQNNGTVQAYLNDCGGIHFDSCDFELIEAGSEKIGLKMVRCGDIIVEGCYFLCAANPVSAACGIQGADQHHSRFENNFFKSLNTTGNPDGKAIWLKSDSAASYDNQIGSITTVLGDIIPLSGTEGADHVRTTVTIQQQYANDAERDQPVGPYEAGTADHNLNPPIKVKGQIIYVLSPTSPATAKLQYWDGSAWKGVAVV